jgi:F420-dependent oxidoreductase-like protein
MRLGLALPHYDTSLGGQPASWEGVARVARKAEASGFDSVWVSDHFFLDWSKYGGPSTIQGSLECWTTMAAIAAVTERIRVGSLVVCNDFRNPALLAKMAASLDLLSNGRLDLGLGAGWYEPEYRAAGYEFDDAKTRITRLGEATEIITRLLSGEELVFKGEHYTVDGAVLRPGPLQQPRPPVWVGGKGDRNLKTIVRHADGWNFSWVGSYDDYEERVRFVNQVCHDIGRDPSTLRRSIGAYVLVGHDEDDARRRYARLVQRTPPGVLEPKEPGSGVSWDEFRRDRIAGTVDEVVEELTAFADLGVEEVIVTLGAVPFQLADEDDLELAGTELAPRLRELNGGTR